MPSPHYLPPTLPPTPAESLVADREYVDQREMLIEAVTATAEFCGQVLSPSAVRVLADDLSRLGQEAVLAALARCRLELRGRLKISDILFRLEDGRPDAATAWQMLPQDERQTVVWTEEIAEAWGMAFPLLEQADVAAARSAFEQAYRKAVLLARAQHVPVRWVPSLGSDRGSREQVLRDALDKGLLTAEHVEQLLPGSSTAMTQIASDRSRDAGANERRNLH